jgi:hypothetical protein
VAGEAEIEQPPDAGDVAADARIHEPRKERHAGHAEEIRLRINPGAGAGLEHLHDRADNVEDENDLRLF